MENGNHINIETPRACPLLPPERSSLDEAVSTVFDPNRIYIVLGGEFASYHLPSYKRGSSSRELQMTLNAAAASKPKRLTNSQRFASEIDDQIKISRGQRIKAGGGYKKSWLRDGAAYGVKSILVPEINGKTLFPASTYAVTSSGETLFPASTYIVKSEKGDKELGELRRKVMAGELAAKVNALYAKPK